MTGQEWYDRAQESWRLEDVRTAHQTIKAEARGLKPTDGTLALKYAHQLIELQEMEALILEEPIHGPA